MGRKSRLLEWGCAGITLSVPLVTKQRGRGEGNSKKEGGG